MLDVIHRVLKSLVVNRYRISSIVFVSYVIYVILPENDKPRTKITWSVIASLIVFLFGMYVDPCY